MPIAKLLILFVILVRDQVVGDSNRESCRHMRGVLGGLGACHKVQEQERNEAEVPIGCRQRAEPPARNSVLLPVWAGVSRTIRGPSVQ